MGPETTIEDLDSPALRRYILLLGRTHSPETLRREVGNIKTFGKWLEAQEYTDLEVKKPGLDRPEMHVLRPEDADRLFETFDTRKLDEARDLALIKLTLSTGLRISEVCDAKLADVDWNDNSLQVWGKGRKQRRVPLLPDVKLALFRWTRTTRKRWAKSDYLFVSRLGGRLDRHRVSGRFRAKIKSLELPYRVRFHDLRHAAATWNLKAGMSKERVSRMLGHANDSITSIYEHLDFEDVQDAHAKADVLRRFLA